MLDALTLDQIRTVLAVAEFGSFRAAALRRGCVPSAVSQAVSQCEAQLGVMLFDRSTYRATPTSGGQQLLEDMRVIVFGVQTLKARATAMASGVEPQLQLALDPLFPLPILSAAITDLRSMHPTLSLKIMSETLGGPVQLVQSKQAQVGFSASAEIAAKDIVRQPMGWMPMVAVAASSFISSFGDREQVNHAMMNAVQIVISDPTGVSGHDDFGVISPRTWRVSDLAVKRQMILDGQGWGGLPLWMIAEELALGRLQRIAPLGYGVDGCTMLECACIYRADQPVGPLGTALLRMLCEVMGRQAPLFGTTEKA